MAGIICVPGADAETGVAVDTDKGTITLTFDEIIATDDIGDLLGDLDGATYRIALAEDIELTFANMSDYELIKPYIKAGAVVIPVATVVELGDEWADYMTAILAFVETDEQAENYVAYDIDDGWIGAVATTVVFATPAAMTAEFIAEMATAVAEIEAASESVVAEMKATYEATIADLTAELAQVENELEIAEAELAEAKAIIDADDSAEKIAAQTKTIAELTKTKDDLTKKVDDLTKEIAGLNDKIKELTKDPEPFFNTGLGKCVIIIVAFLALMVVWYLYKIGKFDKLLKKNKAPKEETKE